MKISTRFTGPFQPGYCEPMEPIDAGKIFKAYDIRGIYGTELSEDLAYRIGRAVTIFTEAKKILIGRDMRLSSVPLCDALVRGVREQGAEVLDIGLCSTPLFYWATQKFKAGVMVTASHNPSQYNGFKICKDGAQPVGKESGMDQIKELVLQQRYPDNRQQGAYAAESVLDAYLKFNLTFLKVDKLFKIVVDAGNRMGGLTYGQMMGVIPKNIQIVPMFFDLDGRFPNHEANPLKVETLKQLRNRVLSEKADLGVALDGDGDRIAFVDNKGEYVPSDITTALIAQQVLMEQPGATILYDIRQSRVTPETIIAAGGKPVMTRVGHAFIKMAMRENKAVWGGELSGHFYNAEVQNCENTQIILFRMLNLLSDKRQTLSELVEPLKRRYSKIAEINFSIPDAKAVIGRLEKEYAPRALTASYLDGLRIDFQDWWFNVRSSNTEPLLRLNMEAKSPELLKDKFEELKGRIISVN